MSSKGWVVDGLGGPDFHDLVLRLLSATVPNDLAAPVHYTRTGPPDMILPRINPTAAFESYTRLLISTQKCPGFFIEN